MTFRIVTIGSPLAPSGAEILAAEGIANFFTPAYPSHDEAIAFLAEHRPEAAIIRLIEKFDGAMMDAAPELKVIVKHGAGTNDIDVEAAKARGIAVLAAAGVNAHSVAEHALGLMLALVKDFPRQDKRIRDGIWDKAGYHGRELRGQKLGLVGFGRIARSLADMAYPIGLQVSAYDPFAPAESFGQFVRPEPDLDKLLETSDIVSLHTPLLDATRGMIHARRIGSMKQGVIFINTSRGEVVDEPALIAALQSGRIGAAGLDSFAQEPPSASALWSMDNVIMTPHVAGVTEDAKAAISAISVSNALDFLKGAAVDRSYFVS